MSEDQGASSNGLILFLLGVAVGAVAVALLTPKSGPDLRADLLDKAKAMKDRVLEGDQEEGTA
jgi:gas vesicle protein